MDTIINFCLKAIITIKSQPLILIILLNVFMIFASYTDLKYMKIYNKFNLVMLAVRLVSFVILIVTKAMTFKELFYYLNGAIIMFLLFLIPAMITMDAIGGDIKFAFNVGLWTGIHGALLIGLIGSVSNFIFRVFFVGKKDKEPYIKVFKGVPISFMAKKVLPLGPFFYLGYMILLVIGVFV